MNLLSVEITIAANDEERLSDLMLTLGAVSVTTSSADESEIFEVNGQVSDAWQVIKLSALFDASTSIDDIISVLAEHTKAKPTLSEVENQDWERSWLDNFKPLKINERLWVCPSWEQPVDESAINVRIDPGMSFGTGTHESTRLCLNWLTEMKLEGKTVVDYGCGSGILAIAALKLGAKKAICTDIEARSLAASLDNAENNQVGQAIEVYLPDQLTVTKSDLVVANILAGTIIELSELLNQLVDSNGQLLLAGILREQEQTVRQSFSGFHWQSRYEGQWVALLGNKQS